MQRKAHTAVISSLYLALHRVGCDYDKVTVKVSGVKCASF